MSGNNGTKRRYPPLHVKLYRLATGIIWLLLKLLAKPHVEGRERVPMEGPVIVVTNHLHHLDVAAGVTIPRPSWVLAAEKYEHHIFGPILRIAGAIFIDRGEPDRSALRQALNVLEDGNALAIAVEGTRSRTGALAEGKLGTAYLATRSGATVVPLAIWGTENIIPAWKRLRRADVYIRYGEPMRFPKGKARTAELEEYTKEIMVSLARLLPEEYRGIYRDHPEVKRHSLTDASQA